MTSNPNILIVDDDSHLRKTLADVLRVKGYTPVVTGTGREALAEIKKKAPAIALIDLKLEHVSGLDVMGEIKKETPDTECIVLTGHASQASAIEAINLGAYSYLQKPYDMEQLLVTIHRAIEKQGTREELKQRAAQLAILNEVGQQIAMVLELDKVLERAVHLVQKSFGYHHVALFIINQAQDELVMKAKAGSLSNHFSPEHRIKLGEGINGWVGQHGRLLLVNDVSAEPRYVNFSPKPIPTQSELSVPIRVGHGVVGVLDVQSPQLNAFDKNDVLVIETLANQIAVAVENARLYGEVQRELTERKQAEAETQHRNRELILLNRVIAASVTNLMPEAVLEAACRELALAFEVPQAAAALLNPKKTEAVVVAEYIAEGRPSAMGDTIPVADNPSFQYLLTHKAPLAIDDAQNDPRLNLIHHMIRQREIVSLLLVPIIVEDEVVGSLGIDAIEPRHFSAKDVDLAWNVAHQVSGVLARARLNEDRQRLEEQYHQAQKMEAIGRLTGGIAHDFNNQLTAIIGYAELMRYRMPPDNPLRGMVDSIMISGQHAADLVRQLLAFSRKQLIQPKVLDVNQIVTEMDKMLQPIIGENTRLKIKLAPDVWPIKADPTQLEQVIANLAVNARDAMPENGKLTLETANVILDQTYMASHFQLQPGAYVLLAISDTGCGMSQETKTHIFEPFFTTKEMGKGTGLGLATVYGIVKQNNGDIQVYSEEGVGTTFKIYFPRTGESTFEARPKTEGELPSGSETILLIEDDAGVRELAHLILADFGYTLLAASNGAEALQVSAQYADPIQLLLTDVIMPDINGKVLADRLLETRPDLKVLFMSGYTDDAITQHGVLDPDVAFIQKPLSVATLARKVREVLDK